MNQRTDSAHLMPAKVTDSASMPDVQSAPDHRHLAIDQVGIARVRHPLMLRKTDGNAMPTVGVFNMTVSLPEDKKGTHMSRFVALLEERSLTPLDITGFRAMLLDMAKRLEATQGRIQVSFPYFVQKTAPVSGVMSTMDYEVQWEGTVRDGQTSVQIKVVVPVTSLCPCSKEISAYGAHNQRSHVTVTANLAQDLPLEELIRTIEDQGSCELWGLLKRTDEKYVTERAYDNPKFVEDLVRDVAASVKADKRIASFVVEAENFESIHNHSAYAMISG